MEAKRLEKLEYEVLAYANIVGEFEYKQYYIRPWDIGGRRPGEKRLLCLRFNDSPDNEGMKPRGVTEFIQLASLFLRRRLSLGYLTRLDDTPARFPFGYQQEEGYVDQDIVWGDTTNLDELSRWLPLTQRLSDAVYNRFILATRFYAEAVQHMEMVPDMAYLNLVSAIEVLSQDTDIGTVSIEEVNSKLAGLFDKIEDTDLRKKIQDSYIADKPFIKRRFTKFILKYTNEEFWNYKSRPETGKVQLEELEKYLENIYDQRSRTLHNGEPFPWNIYQRIKPPDIANIPLDKNITIHQNPMPEILFGAISLTMPDGREIKSEDFIPHVSFFERLVNHVLKNYLETNVDT